jgi:hypothetical protein
MSYDYELRRELQRDHKTRAVYGGVLPVDRLPTYQLRRTPRLYIINTDDSSGPGEHWILVYFKNSRGIYFDSYGFDVQDSRIKNFLAKNSISYIYNSRHLQGALSQTCGYYCLYVARRLARGYSLSRILQDFRTFNNYYNDMLVVSRV